MAIEKMKRLKLAAVRSERERLLKELMLLGCVQISEPEPIAADSEYAGVLKKEAAGVLECKRDYDELCWCVGLLDKYAPQKAKFLSPQPRVDIDTVMDDTDLNKYLDLAKRLDVTDDRIRSIEAKESHTRGVIEALEPWKTLDVPLDLTQTGTCSVLLGTIPADAEMGDVIYMLGEAGCAAFVEEISSDKEVHYILLIEMKEDGKKVGEVMRGFGFSPSSVGEMKGTAGDNIFNLRAELKTLGEQKELLSKEITVAAPIRDEIKLCADRMFTKLHQAENAERLLYTQSAYIFDGWFPAKDEDRLVQLLDRFDCAWEFAEPTKEDTEQVPIKLKSNGLTSAMTGVTEMYSFPAYNGVDPNPLMLPSFAIFFGIMFADIGYGLILLLAGLLIKLRIKPRGTLYYMGGLATVCGISCMVFGAITGTFFGDIIPQVSQFFGGSGADLPRLIDPMRQPMLLLEICLGIGVVHLLMGTAVNAYMLVRDGQWKDALCDVGTVWLTIAGIALGALGVTWYVAIAGAASIVLTQGRQSKSVFGKLGGGLWGLYNFATGWFGDILSYSRLMALMLASTVIGQVFNTLGAMTGSVILFVIIFLLGHALNFGLNIIGSYVHTSRLEYLEFFSKFYREGGREFEPLEIKTNYYICNN